MLGVGFVLKLPCDTKGSVSDFWGLFLVSGDQDEVASADTSDGNAKPLCSDPGHVYCPLCSGPGHL